MIWDLGRMVISLALYALGAWFMFLGYVDNDVWTFLAGPLVCLVGFFVWPSAGVKSKTDPWSL